MTPDTWGERVTRKPRRQEFLVVHTTGGAVADLDFTSLVSSLLLFHFFCLFFRLLLFLHFSPGSLPTLMRRIFAQHRRLMFVLDVYWFKNIRGRTYPHEEPREIRGTRWRLSFLRSSCVGLLRSTRFGASCSSCQLSQWTPLLLDLFTRK